MRDYVLVDWVKGVRWENIRLKMMTSTANPISPIFSCPAQTNSGKTFYVIWKLALSKLEIMFESKLDTNIHVQTWDGCALDNYKEDSMMKTFDLCLWIRRINLQLILKLELICHFCFNSAWIHNENLCPLKCYRAMIVHNQMAFTEQVLC